MMRRSARCNRPSGPWSLWSWAYFEQKLGEAAIFLRPSLKLKKRSTEDILLEAEVRRFLLEHFAGYTAAAGNIFSYWMEPERISDGEHRQFVVAVPTISAGNT